jgi:hypothetical protein
MMVDLWTLHFSLLISTIPKKYNYNCHISPLVTENIATKGCVLTGDGSQECCLPTVQGRFHDLRYITPTTMTDVINGKYDDVIGSYLIIDSRYSYEYEGGHIQLVFNI